MTWVRVDDAFYDHEKFATVTALGIAMWVTGLAYCNRNLTDGFIPLNKAKTLVNCDGLGVLYGMSGEDATPLHGADELVAAGLWAAEDMGFRVVDYLDYQPSKERIKADRQANAMRQAKWRESNGDRNGVSNAPVTPAPTPTPKTSKSLSPAITRVLKARGARSASAVWRAMSEDERAEVAAEAERTLRPVGETCPEHSLEQPCRSCAADLKAGA